MVDKELLRNGSGYVDPTAYKALLEVQRGEKMEKKTGEIWEQETNKGYMREVIVLADHNGCCTILQLIEGENPHCDIKVNCRGEKFTDSKKLQYCFDDSLTSFIRKLSDEEFSTILNKVANSLGIKQKVVEVVKEVKTETPVANHHLELEKTKALLEEYKGLYSDLLKDVLRNG